MSGVGHAERERNHSTLTYPHHKSARTRRRPIRSAEIDVPSGSNLNPLGIQFWNAIRKTAPEAVFLGLMRRQHLNQLLLGTNLRGLHSAFSFRLCFVGAVIDNRSRGGGGL